MLFFIETRAQKKVSFYAEDSLKITADLYIRDYAFPFILLFHQAGYSRGEYREIARKLMKFDYNCLAVDLRVGDNINYVKNETVRRAANGNFSHQFIDAGKDIRAALRYIKKYSDLQVVLFGSSFSASLCLMEAKGNDQVKAVIAFSPGEFFRPGTIVRDELGGFDKPLFVSSSKMEYEYIQTMLEVIPEKQKTIYRPYDGKGFHGAKALWEENSLNNEYWMELMRFFNKIR